jgi:fructosamine-3-kinase
MKSDLREDQRVSGIDRRHSKSRIPPGPGFFQAEAAGLRWLKVESGPGIPAVHSVSERHITMELVATGRPSAASAVAFGRALAKMHACGAVSYGARPPDAPQHGWIGDLPMEYGDYPNFHTFWGLARLLPSARAAQRSGGLSGNDLAEVEGFCASLVAGDVQTGPAVPPARLHGDLWSGNVLWGADDRVWLIDPAAHGGHPSSDLAMLALFGAPFLAEITRAHAAATGIPALGGALLALHQLWPLLVHAALFGPGYRGQAMAALRAANELRGSPNW